MRLVAIESPYAGDVAGNLTYLRSCMRDCFERGEAPFASYALYTQEGVLQDTNPIERVIGISAGFLWAQKAELRAFYLDYTFSFGMREGLKEAVRLGQMIEPRSVGQRGAFILNRSNAAHKDFLELWARYTEEKKRGLWECLIT